MSSLAPPVVDKDQQKAFEPFIVDFPATAPAARLPFHVHSALQAFQLSTRGQEPVKWRVGHVEPIGWFILHENGAPVFIENALALSAFWRLWQEDKLHKTKEIDDLDKRVKDTRSGIDQGHLKREGDKHMADLLREYYGRVKSAITHNPVPNEYGVNPPDDSGNVFNQAKPAGLTAGATPDPANPNIEAEKAASTSSISSDSMGAPGNKTMQPHGSPDAVAPLRSEALPYGDSGEMVSRQTEPNAQAAQEAPPPDPNAAGGDMPKEQASPETRQAAAAGGMQVDDSKTGNTPTDTPTDQTKK